VWPNPSATHTSFVLALPAAEVAEVDVLDVTGRHVRGLHRGSAPPGTLTLTWDGLDDSGRRAAAGLYFALARTPHGEAQARFIRLK
jgi:flagellar hook assembly protein FlgD